jgi:hypothetical protein
VGKFRILGDLVAAGRLRLRDRRWQAALAAGALAVVAVSGALRTEPDGVVPGVVVPDLARYSRCPDEPPVGVLRVGDDVLVTGKSADGTWVELRAPGAPTERVWVPARLIEARTSGLPVRACDDAQRAGTDVASPKTGRPVVLSANSGSGGGARGATTTTSRSAGESPPSTTNRPEQETTTTTTPGPDRVGPSIYQPMAGGELPDGTDRIFDGPACGPTSIAVEAVVLDPSGVSSATLYWSFPGRNGQVSGSRLMERSGTKFHSMLGPFPAGTAPVSGSTLISWWIEATDTAGNTSRANAPHGPEGDERVELASCTS